MTFGIMTMKKCIAFKKNIGKTAKEMRKDKRAEEGKYCGLNGRLGDTDSMIEAWIRISMMELPVSPAEERIIVAAAEAELKYYRGQVHGNNRAA
jgi:hypothetical protein